MNPEVEGLLERWPLIKEFDLPQDSKVVVIGSYKGLAMEALDDLYHPARLIGFDPQLWACEEAVTRLEGRSNCEIITVGLWPGDLPSTMRMGEWHTDACSFVNVDSRQQGEGQVVDADQAFQTLNEPYFDLVVMNIEGMEYQLLPYLRQHDWLIAFERLAVQWHWFPDLGLTPEKMDQEIKTLRELDEFQLAVDERPAWTYFKR